MPGSRLGRLSGPPLIVQFILLVVGALVAAQLTTLLLTLVLPPAPPRDYALADIAKALEGARDATARFDRAEQSGPPDFSSHGWFVSQSSRTRLAVLLRQPVDQVALGFYTQLPIGGSVDAVGMPDRLPADAERARRLRVGAIAPFDAVSHAAGAVFASVIPSASALPLGGAPRRRLGGSARPPTTGAPDAALVQQMPGGPPGGGFPGGGPPGGGFPGGGLPGGGFPQSLPQPSVPRSLPPPMSSEPNAVPPAAPAPPQAAGVRPPPPPGPVQPNTGAAAPASQPRVPGMPPPGLPTQPQAAVPVRPVPGGVRAHPADRPGGAGAEVPRGLSSREQTQPARVPSPSAAVTDDASNDRTVRRDASAAAVGLPISTRAAPPPLGRPIPIAHPATALFGLAPSPFVEGDFVAGRRLADGRWIVVAPRAEGIPNAWQRRVALWFLLSLLAVAPIAWLFAARIVGPLNDFAHAADVLGRNPGAAVLPLDGPAEIGRAAHAFNQMQSRLRGFVDDRTAMIGAISHDLRTPLTRLRFRIEEVPEEQQEDLRGEVAEMEEMISSVIAFMRDAATPNARERRDLAEIVDDVVEDAALLGDVEAGRVESAMVDIDPLGIRRVLDNLLTNAMKYGGGHARVALRIEDSCAVADVIDDGPGVPDAELERIFEPFYRSETARASGREGSGLGLAVCRSIARAHGGDVALFRSPDGFTARVTLPLAFGDDRRAA